MKQKCAEAAFNLIQDGMIIGLGGGSTISLLVQKIEQQKKTNTSSNTFSRYNGPLSKISYSSAFFRNS